MEVKNIGLSNLPIWILPYDPLGDDKMIYTIKNMVVENKDLVYNDGITKFILYTKGTKGGSKELEDLLTYLENTTLSNAVDKELLEFQEIVNNVKSKEDVGERYMTLQEMIDYEKRDSYDEGHIRGIIEAYHHLSDNRNKTKEKIMEQFQLSSQQAEQYLDLYW